MSHRHENAAEHVRDHLHHRRSAIKNKFFGCVQVPLGLVFGFSSLAVAGAHNLVDGPVHDLRYQSATTDSQRERRAARLKAAALLGTSGVAAFFAERLFHAPQATSALPVAVFGAETTMNAYNLSDAIRHGKRGSHEWKSSLFHNGLDTATSAVSTVVLSAPLLTDRIATGTIDTIAGYGHVGLVGTLALITLLNADKD
jgi:hypothetical protein